MLEASQSVDVFSEFCEALSLVKFHDPNKRLGDLLMLETDLDFNLTFSHLLFHGNE